MKVKDLIKQLQKIDQERLVILSSDEEGNSYSLLRVVSECAYSEEDRIVGLEELTAVDEKDGYSEEDVIADGIKAVCLWP